MYIEASSRYEALNEHSLNPHHIAFGRSPGDPHPGDPYPTRLAQQPETLFLPRRATLPPIGPSATGPLNSQQLQNFARDGFLFEPDFLSDAEVTHFQSVLKELLETTAFRGREFAITEPGSNAIRSLFGVHFLSDAFMALARDERLVSRAEQLLGGESYIHQSRINYKPGFEGKGFNWHSDFETWHAEDGMPEMRAVSASIILTDNHAFNGPLMLVPGSHQVFVPCMGETPADNYKQSLKKQKLGTPSPQALQSLIQRRGIQAPTGRAGGLLLFDCNTLHGSNANMSADPRSNVFFVYNRRDNVCREPYAAPRRRPEFLAHHPDKVWSPTL